MGTNPVAQYYDRNTRRFLRFGGSRSAAAIHRAIWAPGIRTSEQAFDYLNRICADEIQPGLQLQAVPHLLDLGCGVGGTATRLAQQLDVRITGVTISQVQLEIAQKRAAALGLADRCQFMAADFLNLPPIGPVCGAYAVEAFIHAADPDRFFTQAASQVLPGGRLVICDDFLDETTAGLPSDHPAWKTIHQFTNGWHITRLETARRTRERAAHAGFKTVDAVDLSAYVHGMHLPGLRLACAVTRLPVPGAYWQNLSGGTALQMCLHQSWTRYWVLVFEKEGICTPLQSNANSSPSTF